jgi:hypothetical protein
MQRSVCPSGVIPGGQIFVSYPTFGVVKLRSPGSATCGNNSAKSVVLHHPVAGFNVPEAITFLPLRSFQVSTSVCLPCQTTAIPNTESTPVPLPKRFTIARHLSKINKPRITVTDNTACITSSYSYTTAQELVRELASAVGMLVYIPGNVTEMPREQLTP